MTRCEHCGCQQDGQAETCPGCGAFATLVELEPPAPATPTMLAVDARELLEGGADSARVSTGFEPWDEALGGGLILGATLVLYGGEGSRKTTWSAAIADGVARRRRGRALVLSPEMPSEMVRDACARIAPPRALYIIGAERDASNFMACVAEIVRLRPKVVVYDSIQNFDVPGSFAASWGAITQVVRSARKLAAQYRHAAILISQVNQAGQPAGPHKTLHDCDMVARLEFARVSVKKNRYAPLRDAVFEPETSKPNKKDPGAIGVTPGPRLVG